MSDNLTEPESEQVSSQLNFTDRQLCRPWWRYAGICVLMIVVFDALDGVGMMLFGTNSDGSGAVGGICVLLMFGFLCLGLFVRLRKPYLVPHIAREVGTFTKSFCIGFVALKLLSVIGCFGQSLDVSTYPFGDGYSLRVPSSFVETEGGHVPHGVALSDVGNELHASVSAIPKIDLTARTVEEVARLRLQSRKAGLINVTAGSPQVETREGRLQANTVLRGSTEGMNLVFVMRHIDFGNDWVEVNMWTTVSRYDKYRDMFRVMANSVKMTDK